MDLFDYKDYRAYLQDLCQAPKVKRGYQASLAKAAGCQASYFSQVLRGNAHLTEDQVVAIAEELSLTTHETDHLLILLRLNKAGTKKLRDYLERSASSSKAKRRDLSTKVAATNFIQSGEDLAQYFNSWIPSVIHVLTGSSKFQTIESIAKRLNLPESKVRETLLFLLEKGFVKKEENHFKFQGGTIHFTKDSVWQPALQSTRRQLALNSIAVNPAEALHFSSVFTITPEDKSKVQELLSEAIRKADQVVADSGTEELCCICVDFFEVI